MRVYTSVWPVQVGACSLSNELCRVEDVEL